MFGHDSVTDAEPQSCSLAYRFSCIERVKNSVWLLNPRTGVRKINKKAVIHRPAPNLQYSATFFLHSVDCIQNNVVKHL